MATPQQLELLTIDPRRDHARQMRNDGAAVREIKKALGVSSSYLVHSWVNDIPPPNRNLRARAKDDVRARARQLRSQGKTYTEISAELGVSKSSCSLWCSDIPRPQPRPGRRRGSTWGPFLERRELERQRTKAAATQAIGVLTPRELLLVGATLYWAEGAKDKPWERRETVKLVNSDESVIRVYLEWLRLVGVDPASDCHFAVAIHETGDARAAVEYWAKVVGVPHDRFGKTSIKRHNPRTNRRNRGGRYRGCLTVTVHKSRVLYQQVDGWWRGIVAAADAAGYGTIELPSRVV